MFQGKLKKRSVESFRYFTLCLEEQAAATQARSGFRARHQHSPQQGTRSLFELVHQQCLLLDLFGSRRLLIGGPRPTRPLTLDEEERRGAWVFQVKSHLWRGSLLFKGIPS